MSDTGTPHEGLWLERVPAEGRCAECGAEDLASYPVNSEGGWWDVVKCQRCLASASRIRGPRLGPISLLSDSL